jgi:hypothetical protein
MICITCTKCGKTKVYAAPGDPPYNPGPEYLCQCPIEVEKIPTPQPTFQITFPPTSLDIQNLTAAIKELTDVIRGHKKPLFKSVEEYAASAMAAADVEEEK